jgi:hypothetical protein
MENTVNVESAAVDGTGRPLWCGLLQNRQTLLRVLQQPRQRLASDPTNQSSSFRITNRVPEWLRDTKDGTEVDSHVQNRETFASMFQRQRIAIQQ